MSRIGLLAGHGKLPAVFSKIARAKGDTVIAFALKGVTCDDLGNHVDKIHWLDWGDYAKALLLLVTERVRKIALLGKIEKGMLFKREDSLDDAAKKLLNLLKDKKDYAVLNEITKALKAIGIEVIDSTDYLKDLIPSKGILTKRTPTKDERLDIEYGREFWYKKYLDLFVSKEEVKK